MNSIGKLLVSALLISVFLPIPNSARISWSSTQEPSKRMAFHDAMRKLWEDHITWTRVFIISAAADLPDKTAATERLLQNQADIGNAIKPYYDEVHQQILHMADMLSEGIMRQFPEKFA